jgi:hypothetical protein
MPALDHPRLAGIVAQAAERLDGDWLLVGGAAAALWLDHRRTTEDVNLVPLDDTPHARYALLDLAAELGLPVEALNSAADFFVRSVPGWRDDLVLLRQGRRGRIFRPGATLFLRLKIWRLSETDLHDREAVLERVRAGQEALDLLAVAAALNGLAPSDDADLLLRRSQLRSRVAELRDGRR